MSLGQALRQFRKQKGLTLAELAEKTGSYVGNLSRIERDMANPSLDLLYRMAQALECTLADIFLATAEDTDTGGKDPVQTALNTVYLSLLPQDRELLLEIARLLHGTRAAEHKASPLTNRA